MATDLIEVAIDYYTDNAWDNYFMIFMDEDNMARKTPIIFDVSRLTETIEVHYQENDGCLQFIATFPEHITIEKVRPILTDMVEKLDQRNNKLLSLDNIKLVRFVVRRIPHDYHRGPGVVFKDSLTEINAKGWDIIDHDCSILQFN